MSKTNNPSTTADRFAPEETGTASAPSNRWLGATFANVVLSLSSKSGMPMIAVTFQHPTEDSKVRNWFMINTKQMFQLNFAKLIRTSGVDSSTLSAVLDWMAANPPVSVEMDGRMKEVYGVADLEVAFPGISTGIDLTEDFANATVNLLLGTSEKKVDQDGFESGGDQTVINLAAAR